MDVDRINQHSLRQSAENASIHGVRQLSLTYHHSKFVLAAWICIICVAFITICYQITTLTSLIRTYPSTIEVSISPEQSIFPTVTACNMGVYKKSAVENIYTFAQMSQALTSVSSRQRSKRGATNDKQIDTAEAKIRSKRQATCETSCYVYGGFCYTYTNASALNVNAQSTCATAGGKLPFFSTVAQYNSYCAYAGSIFPGKLVWLGFWNFSPHNRTNPGVWRDSNGTGSALNFSSWWSAQPDGTFCAVVSQPNWSGFTCSAYNNFLCMCQCQTLTIADGTVTTDPVPAINYKAQYTVQLWISACRQYNYIMYKHWWWNVLGSSSTKLCCYADYDTMYNYFHNLYNNYPYNYCYPYNYYYSYNYYYPYNYYPYNYHFPYNYYYPYNNYYYCYPHKYHHPYNYDYCYNSGCKSNSARDCG